ncbi:MAG: GHKL domain-containing protein, partial [bacterium]|nr:GHKL domain-containing protein [bacterium]
DIEPDREIKINADQVSIALENIINNAVHALVSVKDPGREKKIILGAHMSNTHCAVTIEDTGPGMPAELREQIFNKFYTSKDKEVRRGMGLGLHITQWIVRDCHKGQIEVASEEGVFTRFTLLLPVRDDI